MQGVVQPGEPAISQSTGSRLLESEAAPLEPATYDTAGRRSPILDEVRELWRYRNLVRHMILRDVTARYKRSVLGVAWTLLDPVMTMIVMSIVFTALFSRGIEDFPVFLLSGIVTWQFFDQSSSRAMTGLVQGRALADRVYVPMSSFAVSAVGTGLVNFLMALIPLFGLSIVFGRPVTPALLFLLPALVLVSAFTLGVGLLMSALAAFFEDIHNIYNFLTRLLMWISGIFYYVDRLPQELQWIVRVNPAYHMIRLFRDPIYEGILPRWEIIVYAGLWAALMLAFGAWVFTRFSDEYAYRV